MNDRVVEERRHSLVLSTNRAKLDVDAMLRLLQGSFWAASMTRPEFERAIENSICVGVYEDARQLGFARVVTDMATYAYLTDVIVADDARGRGVGTWMVEAVVRHPDLHGLRRVALWTRDARHLYERCGFATVDRSSTYMELAAK